MQLKYLFAAAILIFGISLFLLPYIPIVWIDEVMFSDVSRSLAHSGKYASRLWEQPETETFLIGHLPLWQLVLAVWYKIFPLSIFWTRLPGLLLYFLTAYLFWKYYSSLLKPETAAILTLLCMGDKLLFEAARSTRMDILGAALFAGIILAREKKTHPGFICFLCALLALVHPNFWFISLIVFISVFQEHKYNFRVAIPAIIPILIYGIWIFPWLHLIPVQLIANGKDHIELGGNLGLRIYNYFYLRYFKWYELQQILPVLYIYVLLAGTLVFARFKPIRIWILILWIQTLFLMFFTGTFPRYNMPIVLLVWTMIPLLIKKLPQWSDTGKKAKYISIILVSFALYPFVSRSVIAYIQKEERNPEPVFTWLNSNLPENKKFLLIDEAIGYYLQNPMGEFSLIHTKDKFKYKEYSGGVYWLTYSDTEDPELRLISKYNCISGNYPVWLPSRQTYKGLKLYQVKTEKSWDRLKP